MKRIVASGSAVMLLLSLNGCWWSKKKEPVVVQTAGTQKNTKAIASFGQYSNNKQVALFDENIGDLESTEDFILAEHEKSAVQKDGARTLVQGVENVKNKDSVVVYFDYDSNMIRPDQQKTLLAHKKKLEEWTTQGKTVVFKGHACDWHGPHKPYDRAYNMHISNTRAMNVAQVCKVDKAQCKVFGVGNEEPIVFEQSKAGQAPNRRVEIYAI